MESQYRPGMKGHGDNWPVLLLPSATYAWFCGGGSDLCLRFIFSFPIHPVRVCVCGCTHAYMHTCIHTYIHVYIHVCVYLCVCTWLEMCVLIEGHTNYVGVSYIYRSYTCLYSVWIVCVPLLCSPIVFIPHFRDPKSTIISTHPRSRIESDCQSSSSSYPA